MGIMFHSYNPGILDAQTEKQSEASVEFPLNSDHTHFLLVDNGFRKEFDVEMVEQFEENLLGAFEV